MECRAAFGGLTARKKVVATAHPCFVFVAFPRNPLLFGFKMNPTQGGISASDHAMRVPRTGWPSSWASALPSTTPRKWGAASSRTPQAEIQSSGSLWLPLNNGTWRFLCVRLPHMHGVPLCDTFMNPLCDETSHGPLPEVLECMMLLGKTIERQATSLDLLG